MVNAPSKFLDMVGPLIVKVYPHQTRFFFCFFNSLPLCPSYFKVEGHYLYHSNWRNAIAWNVLVFTKEINNSGYCNSFNSLLKTVLLKLLLTSTPLLKYKRNMYWNFDSPVAAIVLRNRNFHKFKKWKTVTSWLKTCVKVYSVI